MANQWDNKPIGRIIPDGETQAMAREYYKNCQYSQGASRQYNQGGNRRLVATNERVYTEETRGLIREIGNLKTELKYAFSPDRQIELRAKIAQLQTRVDNDTDTKIVRHAIDNPNTNIVKKAQLKHNVNTMGMNKELPPSANLSKSDMCQCKMPKKDCIDIVSETIKRVKRYQGKFDEVKREIDELGEITDANKKKYVEKYNLLTIIRADIEMNSKNADDKIKCIEDDGMRKDLMSASETAKIVIGAIDSIL